MTDNNVRYEVNNDALKDEEFKLKVKALILSREQLKEKNENLQQRLREIENEQKAKQKTIEDLNKQLTETSSKVEMNTLIEDLGKQNTQLSESIAKIEAQILNAIAVPQQPSQNQQAMVPENRNQSKLEVQNQQAMEYLNRAMRRINELERNYELLRRDKQRPNRNESNFDELLDQVLLERAKRSRKSNEVNYSYGNSSPDVQRDLDNIQDFFETRSTSNEMDDFLNSLKYVF